MAYEDESVILSGSWVMSSNACFGCLHFACLRLGFAKLIDDVHSAVRTLMWHKNTRRLSLLSVEGICTEAWTQLLIRPHRPLLAEWE